MGKIRSQNSELSFFLLESKRKIILEKELSHAARLRFVKVNFTETKNAALAETTLSFL